MGTNYQKHTIYPEAILVRHFKGKVNAEDIIASWNHMISENLISNDMKGVLNDFTSCKLEMNMVSFQKVLAFLKSNKNIAKLKQAVVTNDPKTVVFPMMVETHDKELKIKPFSTESAATSWLIENH